MKRWMVTAGALLLVVISLAVLWQTVFREKYLKAEYPLRDSQYVGKYAAEYGVEPALVYAVIKNESSFDARAKSSIGAMGLMQLTPETFQWVQEKSGSPVILESSYLYDPEVNIHYGTYFLSLLLSEFGSQDTALAAYHAGRSNVKKWLSDPADSKDGRTLYHIPFGNTRVYVKKVGQSVKAYRELYPRARFVSTGVINSTRSE